MDREFKRELILDNYNNPKNRGLVEDESYHTHRTNNESCIDDLNIQIKVEDNVIKDIRFDGEACAISTSATSIMIETLIGKTLEEAEEIITNYENMIDEKEYNEELLEGLVAYDEIYKQPNRKKCALLPFRAIKEEIEERK